MLPSLRYPDKGLLMHDLLQRSDGIREVSWINPDLARPVDFCTWLIDLTDLSKAGMAKLKKLDPARWSVVVFYRIGDRCGWTENLLGGYMRRRSPLDAAAAHPGSRSFVEEKADATGRTEAQLRQEWSSYLWLWSEERLERLTEHGPERRPLPGALAAQLAATASGWRHIADFPEINRLADSAKAVADWSELRTWSREAGQAWRARQQQSSCPEEVVRAVLKAVDLIAGNYGAGLNQSQIAKEVNLSRCYFSVVFKSVIGITFRAFAKNVRIGKAKTLLTEGGLKPIYWIAEQSGFGDEGYFSRVFREETGMLPSEYRRLYGRKEAD